MAKKGTTKYKSNKQEKKVAKLFSGKTVIASGALWFASSDVKSDKFLIECKTTEKDRFIVKAEIWEKICSEAIKDGFRIPLLVVDIKDKFSYVVFPPNCFDTKVAIDLRNVKSSLERRSFTITIANPAVCSYIFGSSASLQTLRGLHSLVCMKLDEFLDTFAKELK